MVDENTEDQFLGLQMSGEAMLYVYGRHHNAFQKHSYNVCAMFKDRYIYIVMEPGAAEYSQEEWYPKLEAFARELYAKGKIQGEFKETTP